VSSCSHVLQAERFDHFLHLFERNLVYRADSDEGLWVTNKALIEKYKDGSLFGTQSHWFLFANSVITALFSKEYVVAQRRVNGGANVWRFVCFKDHPVDATQVGPL
jgi:hypothetical protein